MEGGSITRHILVCFLVLCHLASTAMGGALLVRCQGADGHVAIELTHPTCQDDVDASAQHPPAHAHGVQQQDKHCQDDPIVAPLQIRKLDSHQDTATLTPIVLYVTAFPQAVRLLPAAPENLRPPDSARSLAESVILLI